MDSIARTTGKPVAWQEPEAWTTGPAGDRFRFTYGTETRAFDDGCYNFEVRMQRYEYVGGVDPDALSTVEVIDTRSIYVAEAQISADEARELAALLIRLAEAVER